MSEIPSKRLCFDYRTGQNSETDQGAIHCELLTFERGSWGALPVYKTSSETVNGKQIISGYVESQTDQKFRAVLTYLHPNSRRTSRWHVDHPLLCSMYVDGRKKPVCEHTITQGTHENPVDLTGCASANTLPFANVPSENDTNFSWRKRSEEGEQIACRPPGIPYIDEQSSISFRLSKCEIRKVVRDRSGKAAFPTTDPSLTPGKRDKDFEPSHGRHRCLSHYIHIADSSGESSVVDELVPEFEVESGPFVEFKFYYKSRDLLESLEIARAVRPRRGVGLASSKSLTDLPRLQYDSPIASTSAQPHSQIQRPKPPAPEIVQSPSSRTISGKQSKASSLKPTGYTGMRAARQSSPELAVPSTSSAAFKQPAGQPNSASRLPTPYYPRTPATGSPPRKRTAATQLPPVEAQQPQKKQKITPQRAHQNNEHVETASLPSPPASPVPSTHSDASLPSLSDLLQRKKSPAKQASPTRPFSGLGVNGNAKSPSRTSPSRPRAPSSSTAQQTFTPPKRYPGGRPPLIPGVRKTAVRREPSAAESNAARAAILGRAPDSAPARQATQVVPPVPTPPVSGSGASKSPTKAPPAAAMPTPDATGPTSSTSTNHTAAPVLSSPAGKPDITGIGTVPSPGPVAGPSTPRASTSREGATAASATKAEQVTPKLSQTPSRSGPSSIKVKQETRNVIDLTLESDAEDNASEEESKRNVRASLRDGTTGAVTAAAKREIAERKTAYEHAEDLMTELDIHDVDNIQALLHAGYKTTDTFVQRLARLDEEYRRDIIEGLIKEMGKLDFGLFRAFLRKKGLELAY